MDDGKIRGDRAGSQQLVRARPPKGEVPYERGLHTEALEGVPHQGLSSQVVEKARGYAEASRTDSTLRTYRSAWSRFEVWCSMRSLSALPASPQTVAAYLADAADSLKPQTLRKHLAAISVVHKVRGLDSPTTHEAVRLTMAGVARVKGERRSPKKALRVSHVRRCLDVLGDLPVDTRDRAILLLGFLTGLRRSEIAALDLGDITFEPEGVVLHLRRSKTDQIGRGRDVLAPYQAREEACPVRALRAWLVLRGEQEGPLFIRLDRAARGFERLSGRGIARMVQRLAARASLDPSLFSGHSLRRGFCTEASRLGASETEISRSTGHSPGSRVLKGYIEEGTLAEECAARHIEL